MIVQRELVQDAGGVVVEVMERRVTAQGPRVWVRPVGGGCERNLPADSVTPCDRNGNPLSVEVPQ